MTHPMTPEQVTAHLLAAAATALMRAVRTAITDPARIADATRALETEAGHLSLHAADLFGDVLDADAVAAVLTEAVPELVALADTLTAASPAAGEV